MLELLNRLAITKSCDDLTRIEYDGKSVKFSEIWHFDRDAEFLELIHCEKWQDGMSTSVKETHPVYLSKGFADISCVNWENKKVYLTENSAKLGLKRTDCADFIKNKMIRSFIKRGILNPDFIEKREAGLEKNLHSKNAIDQ